MSRRANRTTPIVISGVLYTDDASTGTPVGSPAWFSWLERATTFYYQSRQAGTFTAHQERRQRGGQYWIAYRRRTGILCRSHLGKTQQLTVACLENAALVLNT
jgi:LuxR family maltose regulon positive regulatory protein